MRSLLLCASVALAGCASLAEPFLRAREVDIAAFAQPPPAQPGWTTLPAPERMGDWIAAYSPGNVTGRSGEERTVEVTLRFVGNGTPTYATLYGGAWTKVDGTTDGRSGVDVTPGESHHVARVLVGATERASLLLLYDNTSHPAPDPSERFAAAQFVGPRVGAIPASDTNATTEARRDASKDPKGLSVSIRDGRVVATFAMGAYPTGHDCEEAARSLGNFTWRDENGFRILEGFVTTFASDACIGPAPARTPRVVAEAPAPNHGMVEVRVNEFFSCGACEPAAGWTTHTKSVKVN